MGQRLKWEVDGIDWPHRHASQFVVAAGIRWHVQQFGRGPMLLLIHGTGASTHSWRDLMPILAQDFCCLAIDLPGHGFTETPPAAGFSLPGMARMVAALLAAMEVLPSVIVAHSAGAAIAAQLCLQERVEPHSIVSINGAFLPFPGLVGHGLRMAAQLLASTSLASRLFAKRSSDRVAVQRMIAMTGSEIDLHGVDLYARLMRNPVHVAAALGMMSRWDVVPLLQMLPCLNSDLHLVCGARDLAVPPSQARRVQRILDEATFTLVERVGHLMHEEKPGQVAALLQKTLRSKCVS